MTKISKLIAKMESSVTTSIVKEYGISKVDESGCTGLNEKTETYYGWSHRAVCGFKVGDKIFDEKFGNDSTPYNKHGSEEVKNLADAKLAAERFAEYVG